VPPELSGAMLVGGLIYAKYRLYASLAAIALILSGKCELIGRRVFTE